MNQIKENLLQKKCSSCEGEQSSLEKKEIKEYLQDLPEWHVTEDDKRLYREFVLKNFMACIPQLRIRKPLNRFFRWNGLFFRFTLLTLLLLIFFQKFLRLDTLT